MVGKLKTRTPFFGLFHRPWGPDWQTWQRSQRDRRWMHVTEPDGTSRDTAALALPARLVLSAPFWVDTADPALVPEMARLRVEMTGLVSAERAGTDAITDTLATAEGRTLVRVCVFPPDLPELLGRPDADVFVPSPLAATLEPDSVHIWEEFEDTVVAVTRGSDVICWEANRATNESEARLWLVCLLAELDAGGFLPGRAVIRDWTGRAALPPDFQSLPISPAARQDGPPVTAKEPTSAWKPPAARLEESKRDRQILIRTVLATAAGAVIMALLAALVYSWLLDFQFHALRVQLAAKEETAGPLRSSANQWIRVERAINTELFPLEILHFVSNCLPPDGVKLTMFELTDDREERQGLDAPAAEPTDAASESVAVGPVIIVRLQGQAQNASLATKFYNTLSTGLPSIEWRMGTPTFQPDNTARFIIEGKRHGTRPD